MTVISDDVGQGMRIKLLVGAAVAVTVALSSVAFFKFSGVKIRTKKTYSEARVDKLLRKYNRQVLPSLEQELSDNYNIILVLTDDQNYKTWQYMPQLKRMTTEQGIVFSNAFATDPTCCPFRASLISGGFDSHETGVKANGRPNGSLYNLDENRTIATYLQSVGIKTGFVGKYMHGYEPGYVPPGWDSFVANEDGGMIRDYWNLYNITYGSSDASASKGDVRSSFFPKYQYITNFQTDKALSFIDKHKNERFFLFLSYYAPHVPHIEEKPEDSLFASNLSFSCDQDSELSLKPQWVQTVAEIVSSERDKYGECGEKSFYGQVSLLQSVDRGFQKIIDKLNSYNLTKKTVILFTSDNGIVLGSKILYSDKGMPYEGSIRVPMIAFIPDVPASTHEELVAVNLDLGATILDLAGAPAPTEGQSLLDIVNRKPWKRNRLLIENYGYLEYKRRRYGHPLPPMVWSGYRTPKWKYVEYTTGEIELYNLEVDPSETLNLAKDTTYFNIVKEYHDALEKEKGLAITTSSFPTAVVDELYKYKLMAWGGIKPYQWKTTSPLPKGLALDGQKGIISGVPSNPGTYNIKLTVTDSGKAKHSLKPDHFSLDFKIKVCDKKAEC